MGLVSTESPTSEVVITSVESAPAAATAFVPYRGVKQRGWCQACRLSVRRSATRSDVFANYGVTLDPAIFGLDLGDRARERPALRRGGAGTCRCRRRIMDRAADLVAGEHHKIGSASRMASRNEADGVGQHIKGRPVRRPFAARGSCRLRGIASSSALFSLCCRADRPRVDRTGTAREGQGQAGAAAVLLLYGAAILSCSGRWRSRQPPYADVLRPLASLLIHRMARRRRSKRPASAVGQYLSRCR